MFSTKDKENVRALLDMGHGRALLTGPKHSKRRRIIADRYANSNVMRDASLHGLQERSQNFIKVCTQLPNQEMDVYVSIALEFADYLKV